MKPKLRFEAIIESAQLKFEPRVDEQRDDGMNPMHLVCDG